MKLNFEVKGVKVVKNSEGMVLGTGGRGISISNAPSLELEVSVTGTGIKDSKTTIELSEVSEGLRVELLSVISKIEKKLNKKEKWFYDDNDNYYGRWFIEG